MSNEHAKIRVSVILIAVLYFALLETSILASHSNELSSEKTVNILYASIQGLAVFICFWSSRKRELLRQLWIGVGFAMTSWFIKSSILAWYAIVDIPQRELSTSLSLLLMVGYLPIMRHMLLSVAKIRFPLDPEKKRFLAGMTMIALAAFMIVMEFVLIPYWETHGHATMLSRASAGAPIILDWLILTLLLFASRKLLERKVEGWALLAIPAAAFNVASDIPRYIYDYTMNPSTINLASITALLVVLAAIDSSTGAFIGVRNRISINQPQISGKPTASTLMRIPWNTLILPALVTSCIPLTWISHMHNGHSIGSIMLGIISIAIGLLTIYRSHLFAIENQALAQDIRIDNLTGLYNHRHFHESLSAAIALSDTTKEPLSLIVLDVDDFAKINNKYGHLYGDTVLATIGVTMRARAREGDEGCRIGGDEFAIIMPDTDFQTSSNIAIRLKHNLQEAIRKVTCDHLLTVSMGVSSYPEIATTKDSLFDTADGALYWGKFHGKNSVLVYDPEVVESLSAEDRARKAEEKLLLDMVSSLVSAVDARDSYTRRHSQNVSRLACRLAEAAGFDKKEIRKIEAAGLLHDIGKIGVPDNILNKPGKLTDEEMKVIMNHPVISAHIIQSSSLEDMAQMIRAHHERWDGKGYPDKLKGEEIPVEARILAIADTYDAMTTDRPYRKGCTNDEALVEISRCSGSQFEPRFAEIFISILKETRANSEDDPRGETASA